MKRTVFILIALLLIIIQLAAFPVVSFAENVSGNNRNFHWQLDENGVFTISGYGEMPYYMGTMRPWYDYRDQIKEVIIGDGITTIATAAFSGCSNLNNVIIPDSVTEIGDNTFQGCYSLKSVDFPSELRAIGSYAFCESGLQSVVIPNNVTYISTNAFSQSGLKSIVIPDSVYRIGDDAFKFCSSLTSIDLGNTVEIIGQRAFSGCYSLKTITIPESVTKINSSAFEGCTSLKTIVITKNVRTVKDKAFFNCSSLTDICFEGEESEWINLDVETNNQELLWANIHYNHDWNEGTIVLFPTYKETGVYLYKCKFCDKEKTEIIPVLRAPMGDVNRDGIISMKDLSTMKSIVAGRETAEYIDSCDINNDGIINLKDLRGLKEMLVD